MTFTLTHEVYVALCGKYLYYYPSSPLTAVILFFDLPVACLSLLPFNSMVVGHVASEPRDAWHGRHGISQDERMTSVRNNVNPEAI